MSTPDRMNEVQAVAHACIDLAAEVGNACFDGDHSVLRVLAGMFVARGAQSVASANLLARAGLVGDAMACGRTMIEMSIDFAYIARDPATRIARFQAHDDVHEYRMATGVANHGGIIPTDFMQELQRRRDAFRANNPGTLSNWAGRTLEDRAREAGRMALYEMPYRDQCNASHSGPGTLEYAIVEEGGQRRVHFGPILPEAHPVVVATSGMIMLIGDIVDSCGIERAFGDRSLALSERLKTFAADRGSRRPR